MSVASVLRRRAERGDPIRFGLVGAGFMGRGILNQNRYQPGAQCAAVCNRTIDSAIDAVVASGGTPRQVTSAADLDQAISAGEVGVTDDPAVLLGSELIACVIEATGHVAHGAEMTSKAIEARKNVILMNAELDATVGPLLAKKASEAGVIYTGCDGDQPAVQLGLYDFVTNLGMTPLVCGNIKGLQDRYRTPTTQESFARQWGQTPEMVTSFADGTKISFEQAIVGNATGMVVAERGMRGGDFSGHVDELVDTYDVEELRRLGGVVDYVVGAAPSPGVYLLAESRDEVQALYLKYGKLGDGPLYSFYVPYHLTVLEVVQTVVRVADFGEAVIAPKSGPVIDVITVAKRDLRAGDRLDGLGGYDAYGVCENHPVTVAEDLLPMGLAEGCVLIRDVNKDEPILLGDVETPRPSLVHELRREQDRVFGSVTVT